MEILRGESLDICIAQCMDEERRCAGILRELLDLRNGLLHVDILRQNEVLDLFQIACTL